MAVTQYFPKDKAVKKLDRKALVLPDKPFLTLDALAEAARKYEQSRSKTDRWIIKA